MQCRAIDNTKTAHHELDNKAQIADAALANSQEDIEKLQVDFNEASGLVQELEKQLKEAKEAAEQKAKQLDVARYELAVFVFVFHHRHHQFCLQQHHQHHVFCIIMLFASSFPSPSRAEPKSQRWPTWQTMRRASPVSPACD